jgi:hypothetical protein
LEYCVITQIHHAHYGDAIDVIFASQPLARSLDSLLSENSIASFPFLTAAAA